MRILQVMAGKGNGGAELYSTDVMLSLHQQGIDQCVALREDAPRAAELVQAGLRMAPVTAASFPPFGRLAMGRLIAREKPDIIHCWMRRAASLVPQTGVATIGWFGDYEEVQNFAGCTDFVGCTEDLVRHMQASGIAAKNCAYIPTFPSVDNLPPLSRAALDTPADANLLLTLSRLHPTKGLDTLLLALQDLPDCYLWIAGDGPMRAELEALAGFELFTGEVVALRSGVNRILKRRHAKLAIEGAHAFSDQFLGVELDAINSLLVDAPPELLELLFLEILVERIGLRLAAILDLRQLRIAEHAVDDLENLIGVRLQLIR